MSRLSSLVAVIQEALGTAWPTLTHRLGAKWLANHEDALPRVVWVPPPLGKERFEPTDFVGQSPQAFRMRVVPVELHASAASFDDAEQLGHDLASAICKHFSGNHELISGGFPSENEAELAQSEHVYVLQVELRLPIVDQLRGETTTLATPETAEVESEAAFPAGVEPDVELPLPLPPRTPMSNPSQPPASPPAGTDPPAAQVRTIEAWAAEKKTAPIWLRAASLGQGWCQGVEVDEATYDAAISAAQNGVTR